MPSFGLLKEQVFSDLEAKYTSDKKLFQEELKRFVKSLKKADVLKEMYQQYDMVLSVMDFDDINDAKDYITETVDYLRSLQMTPQDIKLMEYWSGKPLVEIDPYTKALDTLVFGNRKHIKERVEAKQLLARKLITEQNKNYIPPELQGVFFDLLQRKFKAKLDNLTESELKTLTAFANQNEEEILSTYIHLIDDNISTIDEQITQHGGSQEHFGKLQQAKNALIEMKDEKQPTLDNLERLFVLKEGFVG
jgi:hypothetical protein